MLTDFRATRDAFARQFAHEEIERWTPIEAALGRETRALIAAYQAASKHDKKALEDGLKAKGVEWQEASARLNAAVATLERLEERGENHVSRD